jgi:hypothetical protein
MPTPDGTGPYASSTGQELISIEHARQLHEKAITVHCDDATHRLGALAHHAACYEEHGAHPQPPPEWPGDLEWHSATRWLPSSAPARSIKPRSTACSKGCRRSPPEPTTHEGTIESAESIMTEENQNRDSVLEDWVNDLAKTLNVDPRLANIPLLLDVARDAAHNVTRTAAPVATFLVGLIAAQRGGTPEAVSQAAQKVQKHPLAHDAEDGHPT